MAGPRRGRAAARRAARRCSRADRPGREVAIAWPGWGPLPRLVHEAGGRPVPVPLGRDGAADVDALAAAAGGGRRRRAVALCSPNDPTGGTVDADDVRRLARRAARRAPGSCSTPRWPTSRRRSADLAPLTGELERLLVFRSFSKAHAMAGFRAGYAVGPDGRASCSGGSRPRSASPRPPRPG